MKFDHSAVYICFDPRDPAQCVNDRSTWKASGNAILISATMLHAAHGKSCPISWEKVAALANLCDDPEFLAPDCDDEPLPTLHETNAMLRRTLSSPHEGAR
jgi:hypothetical protein